MAKVRTYRPPGQSLAQQIASRPVHSGATYTRHTLSGKQTTHHVTGGNGGPPTKFSVDPAASR